MKLLDSLLDAIVRLEGDALVMHVGEKPYVVTASSSMNAYRGPLAWGQVELSSRVLTFDAVSSMLGQILPADQQQALTEFGAIEHEIPSPAGVADRFTVVAARGGEDVWVELRRRPLEPTAPAAAPVAVPAAAPAHAAEPAVTPAAAAEAAGAPSVADRVEPAPAAEPVTAQPVASTTEDIPTVVDATTPAPAAQPHVEPSPAATPVSTGASAADSVEPAAEFEIQGIEIISDTDDEPAADIELDAHSSIVVAIPGQTAEEIALNAVPDNAIQIVDDEPQGVPTEEEVDAMLAATAGVILTSGLGVVDDGVAAESHAAREAEDEARDEAEVDEEEMVLEVDVVEIVATASPSTFVVAELAADAVASATPEFELSPPPIEATVAEPAPEPEVLAEAPSGAPLFSEEALLAAAAPADRTEAGSTGEGWTPSAEQPIAEVVVSRDAAQPVAELAPPAALVEPLVDAVSSQPEPPPWTPAPPEAWTPQLPAHFEPASFEPPVPFEPSAQPEPVAPPEPVTPSERAAQPAADALPPEAFVGPPVDAVLSQPETSAWTPTAPEAWVPQLPAHFEPSTFEPPAPFEPAAQIETTAQPAAEAVAPVAFVEPPVDAVLSQPEPPAWTPAQPEAWVPQVPAYFEPAMVEPTIQIGPAAQIESPMHVEPAPPAELPMPDETPVHEAEMVQSAVEGSTPTVPALEAAAVIADEPAAAMAAAADQQATISQGGGPAASEPMPPIEAPSVPEMTMEVTPELQQQETPMVHMASEAASSMETPATAAPEAAMHAESSVPGADEARQAVVVPLSRSPIKTEVLSVPFTPSEDAALMHTLRVAAARGASTVYVVAQSKPMVRIDGDIIPLESEPTLTAADVDRLVMELAPPRRREAFQSGPVEWLCDVPEIGRVRCLTFRDHRGPGVLFRMFPPRAISADQLGLTPEVQALCQQSDGLVLVTGARASGKSTLLNSFVDLINRTRSDHLITIESQIGFVHESRRSFISQRETRGDADLAATYARAALREDPDVMMIEDLKSADLVSAALEAAESGRLVLASVPAASTIGALERLIEVFPADRRAKVRTTLATALRGVIAQVLLRRVTGGRVAAREILLNTPAVSQIVLEGKMFQLPVALDSGRRHGMVPLTDSLAAHVREGTVNVAEAYRKALDRAALVALLKREGLDTSFAERLA